MIETRLLQYFLAIAREQGITRAAESLHVSQPTLSRHMKELEDTLGVQLFVRGRKQTTLTEEGRYFRARAQEIVSLMDKTESTLNADRNIVAGDIVIGCGETPIMAYLTELFAGIHEEFPDVHLQTFSGDADAVMERLDKGLVDLGLLLGPIRAEKYDYLDLPWQDEFGLLMPKDHPLTSKSTVTLQDMQEYPVSLPRQLAEGHELLGARVQDIKPRTVISSYNLLYNATFLVEQGVCLAFALDRLADVSGKRNLTFRPFEPAITVPAVIVTKKYQTFSPTVKLFLDRLQERIAANLPRA